MPYAAEHPAKVDEYSWKVFKTCTLLKKTSPPLQAAAFVSLKWVGFKVLPAIHSKFDGGFWEAV